MEENLTSRKLAKKNKVDLKIVTLALPCRSVPFKREERSNRVGAQNIPTMEGMEIINSRTRTVSLYLATSYQGKVTHVDYLL